MQSRYSTNFASFCLFPGTANSENSITRDFNVMAQETIRLSVSSALFKQRTGGLVVRWVTTSEYPLLYVLPVFASFTYH
jgi:hypothetical protein